LETLCQVCESYPLLPWISTIKPVLVLLVASGLWLVAFVLVIVLLMDVHKASTCMLGYAHSKYVHI
jgi:hypothetical protein